MRVDGKKIAETIIAELDLKIRQSGERPTLAIVYAGSNPVIENFIKIKMATAHKLGVSAEVFHLLNPTTEEMVQVVSKISSNENINGIIVQLPLPPGIDSEEVLNSVSPLKDIDVLSKTTFADFVHNKSVFMPPTAGAVSEIFSKHKVILKDKKIVVVGNGALVGRPVEAWLRLQGADPIVVTSATENSRSVLLSADIIISGVGAPMFIKSDMVKDGVVLIDAGTSEEGGKMIGDIDPTCEGKASLFTPVPGGVGPITVAILFRNLVSTIKIK